MSGNALLTQLQGGGGSSSGLLGALQAAQAPSGGGGGHGLLGFAEHLGGDIRDATVGLPTGLVQLAEHPESSIKMMGKSTWQDWSPLVHGHVGEFAHNFYAHPLAPLLDVATVLTGGAGIAGRLSKLGLDAGLVKDTSAIGKLGKFSTSGAMKYTKVDGKGNEMPTLLKHTSSNPLSKAAQLSIHKVVNDVSPHLPKWLGDGMSMSKRYDRLDTKMMAPRSAALQAQIATFVRAGKDLTGPHAATYRRAVLRNSYDQLFRMGKEWDKAKPLPEGYKYVTKIPRVTRGGRNDFFALKTNSIESDLSKQHFGRRYTTVDPKQAAVGATAGHGIIVPLHTIDRFLGEGVSSSKTLKMLYNKPTEAWKMALLGYNPGFFTHNAVGNFFMFAMQHGGAAGARGFADALAQTKGEAAALHSIGRAGKSLNPHWMDTNFRDQLNNTFSMGTTEDKALRSKLYRYSMFPVTHAVADQFLRRAAINSELRKAPEVQKLMKGGAMGFDEAAGKALSGDGLFSTRETAANLRDRTSQKVMDSMGDYHSLNAGERRLQKIMPFYTWNRHALRFTKAAVRDHPGRVAVSAQLSQQGTDETKKLLGNVPEFMLGSIPGSLLGIKSAPGRKSAVMTSGLNPFSTINDLKDAAVAVTGLGKTPNPGGAILANANPLISGAVTYITGQNPMTGAHVPRSKGGLVGSIANSTFGNLPQVTLAQRLISGNPQPKPNKTTGKQTPFLFSKNKQAIISQMLGAGIKQMDPDAAQKMFDAENGKKKGRKSSNALLAALQSS